MKMDSPKAPTIVHDPLGITNDLNEKASIVADCIDNQFTSHNLFDENHERCVEA
jgi:hypothetical protein